MAKFELYKSPNGEYRWRLKATNGQVIATGGEGYSPVRQPLDGIASVKRSAAEARFRRRGLSGYARAASRGSRLRPERGDSRAMERAVLGKRAS